MKMKYLFLLSRRPRRRKGKFNGGGLHHLEHMFLKRFDHVNEETMEYIVRNNQLHIPEIYPCWGRILELR